MLLLPLALIHTRSLLRGNETDLYGNMPLSLLTKWLLYDASMHLLHPLHFLYSGNQNHTLYLLICYYVMIYQGLERIQIHFRATVQLTDRYH